MYNLGRIQFGAYTIWGVYNLGHIQFKYTFEDEIKQLARDQSTKTHDKKMYLHLKKNEYNYCYILQNSWELPLKPGNCEKLINW